MTRNATLGAPQDAGVLAALSTPESVKRLEIAAIVRNEHPSLLGGVFELLAVGHALIATTDLVNRDGVDASCTQAFGDALAHILVE